LDEEAKAWSHKLPKALAPRNALSSLVCSARALVDATTVKLALLASTRISSVCQKSWTSSIGIEAWKKVKHYSFFLV
jgi:hypothetical protein